MVDGGVELRTGVLPLAIQILSTQRTTMTTAEKETAEGKDTEWRINYGKQQLENLPDKSSCVLMYMKL